MKRTLIIPVLTAVITLAVAAPAYARDGTETTDNSGSTTTETTVTNTDDTSSTSDSTAKTLAERLKEQRERIQEQKTELENEIKQKKEDRKEKLEGRRLAQCENRQDNINSLLDKSAALGKERLARIQAVEEGVKAFYEKQQLSSTEYDAALKAADEKQAAAIAALDVVSSENFNCDQVDGSKPSDIIHTTNEAKRTALKDYRDSVQELIRVVRQAFVDKVQAAGGQQ